MALESEFVVSGEVKVNTGASGLGGRETPESVGLQAPKKNKRHRMSVSFRFVSFRFVSFIRNCIHIKRS